MKNFKTTISNALTRLSKYRLFRFVERSREKRARNVVLNENEKLEAAPPILFDFGNEKKPRIAIVKDGILKIAYWQKFQRFCDVNKLDYEFIDSKKSNFLDFAKKFDVILWRTSSNYGELFHSKTNIYYIEKILNKIVMPNYDSLWYYEEKINQYQILKELDLNPIKTFISYDFDDTQEYLKTAQFPIVVKLNTSSASVGVKKIQSYHKALRYFRKVFGNGISFSPFGQIHQGYAYIQELTPNEGYDLRIIAVGDSYFGYYRYPTPKDFRASGSGIVVKKAIPVEALANAKRIKDMMPQSYMLAVDFLKNTESKKFEVIETSIFIKIETCEQLMVDGVPGRYIYRNGNFIFEKGRFWLQDFIMIEVLKQYYSRAK